MKHNFALQHREPYPFKVRHELRKNMTNLPERWKEIAFAETVEALTPYVTGTDYRIVNWSNLEVVLKHNPELTRLSGSASC